VPQPSLAYAVASHPSGHAVIDWQGPASWSADDLVFGNSRRDRQRARACEILSALMKNGPRPARELTRAARQQGISPRTLRRARQDLNVKSQIVGGFHHHRAWWLLPGQELPDGVLSPEMKELQAKLDRLEQEQLAETGRAVA
jgi:hypothetical protein